jgi:DNA-binding IclR family transcriptional regulator
MIQVINRAFDILEFIAADADKPRPLGEIASALGLNAGTTANIIKTLVARNYLEKIDKQKGYCLGPMAYRLSGNEGYQKALINAAKPEMEAITRKMNENTLLCVLKGDMRIVILRVQSDNELQANTAIEKKASDTASGRLLIAMQEDTELEKYIAKYGVPEKEEWDGVTDKKSFLKQVNRIRTQGYAAQITKNQIIGLALPVMKAGRIIAALSIYMPVLRYNNSNKQEIIKLIRKASEKISKTL